MFNVKEELRDYLQTALGASFKKYFCGYVPPEKIAINQLPALCVYGTGTELVSDEISTARDKWRFNLKIDVVTSVYASVSGEGIESDDILQAQRTLEELVEERDADGKPLATSIVGALRANLVGDAYFYTKNISVEYANKNEDGKIFFMATLTLNGLTRYNTR